MAAGRRRRVRQARNFRGYMKKCLGPFVGGLAGFLWGERIAGEWAVAWSWGESQGKR